MTVHFPGLSDEIFCLSDSRHSDTISRTNDTFTLAEGESEFAVRQIANAPATPRGGWLIYLMGQILTAPIRALFIRKAIYERCDPILLSAKVKIKPCRYDFCTLFFSAGGYSEDTHTYFPPHLQGEEQLHIEPCDCVLDEANLVRALREETYSKIGYAVWLALLPILLCLTSLIWESPTLFAVGLMLLVFCSALCIGLGVHSRKVKRDLRKKVGDTLHYLRLGGN